MTKAFLVDVARCNGCRNCQIACKDEYCDNDWTPYAKPQPEIGQFWMSVSEKTRGQVPVVKVSYYPTLCGHCENAPCAAACDQDAFERREDGLLFIVPEKCNGCMKCVDVCPLGVVYANSDLQIAQKCAACAHLLDDGWTEPRCVDACPTSALKFVNIDEIGDAAPAEAISKYGSHVFYVNLPKRFAAGLVADREINEVLIGAKAILKNENGEVILETQTNEFGDYKFDPIEPAKYTVTIEAEGYKTVSIEADVTKEDKYLGDYFMTRI